MVHVVVKNSPFIVTLGLSSRIPGPVQRDTLAKYITNDHFDLSKLSFDCALIYDLESEKEVDYVQNKPFQFKVQAAAGGESANLEIRLKVLSSQHEDTFFRVKIVALDPVTKQPVVDSLKVVSAPIKVISKPEQLKKRRPTKKRTLNDLLVETLTRIEQGQQKQQKLLDQLCDTSGLNIPAQPPAGVTGGDTNAGDIHAFLASQSGHGTPPVEQASSTLGARGAGDTVVPIGPAGGEVEMIDFPDAIANLLRKYNALEASPERSSKIQKIMAHSGVSRTDLVEMNDLFMSEGLQREIGSEGLNGTPMIISGECSCPNCPHKAELERIELFYKDVFHLNAM